MKKEFMGIRPEHFYYEEAPESVSGISFLQVEVEVAEPMGAEIFLYFTALQTQMIAKVTSKCPAKPGSHLTLSLNMRKAHFSQTDEPGNSITFEEAAGAKKQQQMTKHISIPRERAGEILWFLHTLMRR